MQTVPVDGLTPRKAHPSDAAFDLAASHAAVIRPGHVSMVNCGFAIAIPEGHVGLVCSRSGLALKHGVFVLNAPGVIDPGYRGDVCVLLTTLRETHQIGPGDRIAQLLIVPTAAVQLVQNKNGVEATTDRGEGGFGSTGQ